MTEQPQQGQVLAVHTSQLSTANMEQLVQQGYGILPDQSGWLIFVRVPQERDRSHDVRRLEPPPDEPEPDDVPELRARRERNTRS